MILVLAVGNAVVRGALDMPPQPDTRMRNNYAAAYPRLAAVFTNDADDNDCIVQMMNRLDDARKAKMVCDAGKHAAETSRANTIISPRYRDRGLPASPLPAPAMFGRGPDLRLVRDRGRLDLLRRCLDLDDLAI